MCQVSSSQTAQFARRGRPGPELWTAPIRRIPGGDGRDEYVAPKPGARSHDEIADGPLVIESKVFDATQFSVERLKSQPFEVVESCGI